MEEGRRRDLATVPEDRCTTNIRTSIPCVLGSLSRLRSGHDAFDDGDIDVFLRMPFDDTIRTEQISYPLQGRVGCCGRVEGF